MDRRPLLGYAATRSRYGRAGMRNAVAQSQGLDTTGVIRLLVSSHQFSSA
jgi:hypothetical protein